MRITLVLIFLIGIMSCNKEEIRSTTLESPGKINKIGIRIDKNGLPFYQIFHKDSMVLDSSYFGFEFLKAGKISEGYKIGRIENKEINEPWEMPWGEQVSVQNHCWETTIHLSSNKENNLSYALIFRAYDDGIAFRYHIPGQKNLDSVFITEEHTSFSLTGNHETWWIPGDWDIYEHLYQQTNFEDIDATIYRENVNLAQTSIPHNAVNTPVTMKSEKGIYLSFHEANLTDYSGMTLGIDKDNLRLHSILVGSDNHPFKVRKALPFSTPWRTIQIADKAGKLIESNLIVNLNEPNKLGDVSWFTPMKYVGIWWEMHVGKSSWDLASGKHGATTANAKKYIDFAARNNIGGVLVEGWNTGWERWIGFEDREGVFDFITPYEDYDLKEVVRYGKEKGVEIIMHHETSAAPRTYDMQMDTAYALMKELGIHSVKTGYVGKIIPKGEYHHGQWMVNHYRRALLKAAEKNISINAHEPIKATGLRRTYPNAISREGLRGQEFNAWAADGGNPPGHLPTVAFTRMLAGPIDFTPGVFDIKLDSKYPDPNVKRTNQINTTLAQQLALYVVIYSPIQMACDLPENYEGKPAFQFIRDVGVDWEKSKVLNGEVGEYVTIARKEKGTDNWFVGGITDENEREMTIDFGFLEDGVTFNAIIYRDADDAHWDSNPESYEIESDEINSEMKKRIRLAPGGGFAISLKK